MSNDQKTTVTSNPNIAIIKYWGKENKDENICSNPSISFQCTKLITTTSISYNAKDYDEFIFNGAQTKLNSKIEYIVNLFKSLKKDKQCILIESNNSFPHSAGMASSASGFSALVLALDKFYKTNFSEKDLSILARKCSGSASRSIPKDIVMCDKEYSWKIDEWKEIKILLIRVSNDVKKVSSTEGMCRTQETSFFYKERQSRINEKLFLCQEYIKTRDHQSLFKLIMRESNEIHAVMFESYPPIRYISDKGYEIMEKVHQFNAEEIKMAYTFDAGTNPFIFVLENNLDDAVEYFKEYDVLFCN